MFKKYKALLPSILGLCFARSGIIVSTYAGYSHTDDGMFTDGAMLVVLLVMAAMLLLFDKGRFHLHKTLTNRLMRTSITGQVLCCAVLPTLNFVGAPLTEVRFTLSALAALFGSLCVFYWLRRTRGAGSTTAAVFVFSALAISEVEIYVCLQLANVGCYISAVLALAQFACLLLARRHKKAYSLSSFTAHNDYFAFTKSKIGSKRFLSATGISIGFLSVAVGFLRGYPDGAPIAFQPATRLAYGLLTIAICIILTALVLRKHHCVMTVGIFILMELFASAALILYAAFPEMLDIGAVFTTTLNALMVAFTWYVIIAFMSFGWRDPYYYAIGGWIVWLGCRGLARVALMNVPALTENDILVNAVMSASILISAQVALGQFVNLSEMETEDHDAQHKLQVAGLTNQIASLQGTCDNLQAELKDAGKNIEVLRIINAPESEINHCGASDVPTSNQTHGIRLARLMGIDNNKNAKFQKSEIHAPNAQEQNASASVKSASHDIMMNNAKAIGKQFLLTNREVEVLALYAQGKTQKRVAQELFISPDTAHAHIKRIYTKTNMHSRQEILDYIENYL